MHCPHCEDFNCWNPAVVGAVAIVVAVILFITAKVIFKSRATTPPSIEQIAQPPKTGAMLQPSRSDAGFFRRS